MSGTTVQACPVCGGAQLVQTLRGYAGRTDTPHQYLTCQSCGQIIYEIMSVTQRDIRLYRYEVNGLLTHEGLTYQIRRVLKVGFDEYLLYLKVVAVEQPDDNGEATRSAPAGKDEAG